MAGRWPAGARRRSRTRWWPSSRSAAAGSSPASRSPRPTRSPTRTSSCSTSAPPAAQRILGDRQDTRAAKAYRRYEFGPGTYKIDLAVEGGIPWTNPDVGRAGTVHLGGTLEEIAAAEADTVAGRMPERPFVLLGQQSVADPSRSVGDVHPVYAYAHVPHAWPGDATETIIDQIERFAPGFRDRIVGRFSRSTADLAAYNANYVGGDIATGRNSAVQVVMRPRVAVNPYKTGATGFYLCSAATPPGAGVHGMGGFHAAQTALDDLGKETR